MYVESKSDVRFNLDPMGKVKMTWSILYLTVALEANQVTARLQTPIREVKVLEMMNKW